MATFLTNLWESIFTPGPTPTLLLATNATFAALQLLLFVLLVATYSVHFVVLSVLTGGLWWAINWFAAELRSAQEKEEEAKRIRKVREGSSGSGGKDGKGNLTVEGGEGEGMDSGDDTETETELGASGVMGAGGAAAQKAGLQRAAASVSATGAQAGLKPLGDEALRKRGSDAGELSTDSEWEKVDEDR